jgi:thymidylate synthase (FAD)
MIEVLDKGYVRLADVMGSDLSIVNSARVSFAKESAEMVDSDKRLIAYLAEHEHTSPFRHAFLTLEIKAPLMVARQWWKYVVGSDHTMDAWNEASRRYITTLTEFYVPVFRSAPDNKKQGSGGVHPANRDWRLRLMQHQQECLDLFDFAINCDVAPELARGFLPSDFQYVLWRWSASLQSVAHFINQRTKDDAQYEIREYAYAVRKLAAERYPISVKALCE